MVTARIVKIEQHIKLLNHCYIPETNIVCKL